MALNLRAVGAKRVLLFGIACMMISYSLQGCTGTDANPPVLDPTPEPEPDSKAPDPTPAPAPVGKKPMTEEEAQVFIGEVTDSCEKSCEAKCQGLLAGTTCGKCLQETCHKQFHDKCEEQGYDMESEKCQSGKADYVPEAVKYVVDCGFTGLSLHLPEYVQCCLGYITVGLKLMTPCLTEGEGGGKGPEYR